MSAIDRIKLKIKRGESPFYRTVRRCLRRVFSANLPHPRFLKPVLRVMYELHYVALVAFRRLAIYFYSEPLFRSRCAEAGRNLTLWSMPFVDGHVGIYLGDDVTFGVKVDILSGRFSEHPRLVMKDRAGVGSGTVIVVNREVVIEEDVIVSVNCRISDSDGHPRDATLRAQHAPLNERDIRPVRICRSAWVGNACHIMKGVTIGEGAIIGANSVVVTDIPPYSLAMGNPAEVYFRNIGKSRAAASGASG